MMTTGYVTQGQSALYLAETRTGQFGVYTMGPGPNGSGVVIRRHDMTKFRSRSTPSARPGRAAVPRLRARCPGRCRRPAGTGPAAPGLDDAYIPRSSTDGCPWCCLCRSWQPHPGPAPMIDAHIHVVPPNLPGVGPLSPLLQVAPGGGRRRTPRRRCRPPGVTHAFAMGEWSAGPDDPLGVEPDAPHRRAGPRAAAPSASRTRRRTDDDHFRRVEAELAARPGGRPEGVPRLPALRAGPPELPPLLRTGREVRVPVDVPHRRHVLAAGQAEVRPPARRGRGGGRSPGQRGS